jgi:type VI secretion system secreted protein Hcp
MRPISPKRALKIAVPTLVALGAGATFGMAAIPSADGTIHSCITTATGAIRIIDAEGASPQTCGGGETELTWNQRGPTGATGAAGAAGAAGPAGPKGDTGAQGAAGLTGDSGTSAPSDNSSSSGSNNNSTTTTSQAGGPSAQMFLRLDGVPGDSADDNHKNQIDVSSFAFAVGRGGDGTGSGGRGAAGRSHLQTMRINKVYDSASPKLFRAAATGQHIRSAVLTFRRAGDDRDVEFLTYTLSDVQVTSYDQGGTDGDARDLGALEEEVGLTAAKVHVTEQTVGSDGKKGPVLNADWTLPRGARR